MKILTIFLLLMLNRTMASYITEDRVRAITANIPKDTVEALTHGVLFRKVAVLDLSSSEWLHIIRIPQLPPLPKIPKYQLCDKLPQPTHMVHSFFTEDKALITSQIEQLKFRKTRLC